MQCYTELIPPSTVTQAVSLPFLDSKANNLIVAKTSLLQIFRLSGSDWKASNDNGPADSKLVLVAEYSLSGTITALSSVKTITTKSGGDALLVAFKDAKLSLIEWDPDNYTISTISIHYYEGENVVNQPFGPSLSESSSILTVDPSSRCAALKFGARHLAILPFRQSGDELAGGEDDEDAEMEAAPASATSLKRTQSATHEASDAVETPYKASFVLSLTALDPSLTHPIHLSFLHEYREPTFGILSASRQPSSALLEERKDVLSYTVFTLDLEQRASTNLISVPKLPSDLWRVIPLPLPVGGALLVGTNELVHVDQSGKTNAVVVNEYAKVASNLGMTDQLDLNMKLENCEIESLDPTTGDLLLISNDASLAIVTFRLQGRNVAGLSVTKVSPEQVSGSAIEGAPSCTAVLNGSKVFIGSEDGDSTLLGWTKPAITLSRKRSHAQMLGTDVTEEDEENEDDDMDDDDLYAPAAEAKKRAVSFSNQVSSLDAASSYHFETLDKLLALGPINHLCFGRSPATDENKIQLLAGVGRGEASRLAFLSKEIVPEVLGSSTFDGAKNAWSIRARTKDRVDNNDADSDAGFDNMLFVEQGDTTKVYDIVTAPTIPAETEADGKQTMYTERVGTEFEHEGGTLAVSTLSSGSRIVQCRRSEIRTYEAADLALSQIIPMIDDETDEELKVVHFSFCDPYLLVIRDDGSVLVLKADRSGDVEPLDTPASGELEGRKWHSGCLYSAPSFFSGTEAVAFLLGDDGGLYIFSLPDFKLAYAVPGLSNLPAVLSPDAVQRRTGTKETLTELLFADLGTGSRKKPYLILRSAMDDLTLYKPWTNKGEGSWESNLRFRKVPITHIPKFDDRVIEEDDGRPAPLRSMNIGGRGVVHVPGAESCFIVKESSASPKVLSLRAKDVRSLTQLHHGGCENGFGVIDSDGSLQECSIPANLDFSTGWSVRKVTLGDPAQEVRQIAYHDGREMYVVAACRDVEFVFPEDDWRHNEQDDISLRPLVPQYTLHLLSARTHDVIHSFDMPYLDTITSLKVMPLEVSEHTHEQKPRIVVGTAAQRGEDMPAKGTVYVFEVLDVVPEPDRAESGCKLHIISREETKGAITAVESFPGGLIGTAQGQKIMIRGLKEDGSCLPVAFLDAQCYTTQLKTFARSGMWLAGDARKGLWFGGFTEEPYKLTTLGKSRTKMDVVAAEFLPFEGQLYLMVIDADMDLHVLQYDPENPKSLSGSRLLHRSTMHLGQFSSGMYLLPSTLAPTSEQPLTNGHADGEEEPSPEPPSSPYQVLTTSFTGAVGLITPVDEPTYRRLGSIQTHLTSVLEHPAGLNPRAYRAIESEGFGARGIIDGSLVQRVCELGSARRAEVLGRAGADIWGLRSDLEIIGGGGLGYL